MKEQLEDEQRLEELRRRIIGLGERSQRKSYYPQLQERIAQLENAYQALQESEEKFRTLVEHIDIGIYRTRPDGTRPIVQANPAMARMFGYGDASELLTVPPTALYADPEERDGLLAVMRNGGMVKDRKVRMRRRDGTIIVCSLTFTPVRGPDGAVEFIDGIMEDVTEQIRMESELRASETQYRQLVDNALEGIWAVDKEWKTSFVNQSMADMLGYSPEEMLGRPLTSFMDESAMEEVNEYFAQRESSMSDVQDFEFVRKDGTKIYTRVSASALRDPRGRFAGGVALVSDVTARRRTEEALRQSEERFRSLIEQAPVAIAMNRDVRLEYVNPAYVKMFGYEDAHDLKGRTIMETVAPACREEIEARALRRNRGLPAETEFDTIGLRKDGSQLHVHGSAVRINLAEGAATVVFFTDITERKREEEELRQGEKRFRTLIEDAPVAIAMSREGFTTYGNPRYLKLFGLANEEDLYGRPFIEQIAMEDRGRALESARAQAEGRGNQFEMEALGMRRDGSTFPFHVAVTVVDLTDGPAVLGFFTDITERKAAEEALRSSEQMLKIVLDQFPGVVYWKDRNSVYLGANRESARIAGFADPSEYVGKTDYDLPWAKTEAVAYRADDREVMESGQPKLHVIERQLRADGKIGWLDTSKVPLRDPEGTVIGVLGTSTDITEQRNAEEALQDSQQMLQLVLDNVPDRVFWKDRDSNFLGCNRNAARDAGLSDPKDIIGKNDHELAWRGSANYYRADDRQVIESGIPKINFEELQIQADGSTRWLQTSKVPLRDPDGRIFGLLGTYEDITERKRAEEDLRNSEERFRTLADATFEGIVVHADGIILDANQAALEQTGYTREEAIGRPILDFFTPDSQAVIREVFRQPQVKAYEAHLIAKSGEVRTVQIQARAMEYNGLKARVATIMDITEQVEARQRIEELVARKEGERLRLRTILDTLPVGVVIVDGTGQVTENNERAHLIWGPVVRNRPENVGEYGSLTGWWADTGLQLKAEDWTVARAMRENRPIVGDLIDIQRQDGSRGTVINSAAPLQDRGRVIGGVVVTEDITKQRELEHEAIAAKERAELYIDLLTHDINNMNTAARGFLQLVEGEEGLDEKSRQRLAKSQGALDDISELIGKVKKIQIIEAADARRGLIDLGWTIEDVVHSFKEYPGKEVKINYRPQLRRMVLASELLSDVFTNLIGNAVKHSDGPVTVDVNISKIFEEGREYYLVAVEDDGPGVSDEMKNKIFSRLQRGKTRASGSGLGLYLVKSLVEDFQGRVWVEDRVAGDPAKGAKFVVMLPVVALPEGAGR